MRSNLILTATSLLSIVLFTLHLSDDMVRGFSTPGLDNFTAVAILVVFLYGALLLPGRLSGYIIVFLGSLAAAGMPLIHLRGTHIVETVRSDGGFLFYWTVFSLGVTGVFGMILAARGMWELRRGRAASV
jgi:hypothetical protein